MPPLVQPPINNFYLALFDGQRTDFVANSADYLENGHS